MQEVEEKISFFVQNGRAVLAKGNPPSFLLPFIRCNEIVYIYKKKMEVETDKECSDLHMSMNDTSSTEDYTGQPLECPFSIHNESDQTVLTGKLEVKEKDQHYPLSLKEARNILGFYFTKTNIRIPLWVLTDGNDISHTILLGGVRDEKGYFTRLWATLSTIDSFSAHAGTLQVQRMVQNHQAIIPSAPLQTEVCCIFVMDQVAECATLLQEPAGHIELHCSWKTPSIEVPVNESITNVVTDCIIGHESSILSGLWRGLLELYDLLQLVKKWRDDKSAFSLYLKQETAFPSIVRFEETSCDKSPVLERLQQLLLSQGSNFASLPKKNEHLQDKQLMDIIFSLISSESTDIEFTDQIWTLFTECTSYRELSQCFETMYQYVRNGSCKPYLKWTNISRLANALQLTKKDPDSFECMLEPVEMLIEIGIDKLRKDYMRLFLSSNMATAEQLCIPNAQKFASITTASWYSACCNWLSWFVKLHASLETILLVESTLRLEASILSVTTAALKHYLENSSTPLVDFADPRSIGAVRFQVPIKTQEVQSHIANKVFSSWRLKLVSEMANRSVTTVFYNTFDDTFPSAVYDKIENHHLTMNNTNVLLPCYCICFYSVSEKLM